MLRCCAPCSVSTRLYWKAASRFYADVRTGHSSCAVGLIYLQRPDSSSLCAAVNFYAVVCKILPLRCYFEDPHSIYSGCVPRDGTWRICACATSGQNSIVYNFQSQALFIQQLFRLHVSSHCLNLKILKMYFDIKKNNPKMVVQMWKVPQPLLTTRNSF